MGMWVSFFFSTPPREMPFHVQMKPLVLYCEDRVDFHSLSQGLLSSYYMPVWSEPFRNCRVSWPNAAWDSRVPLWNAGVPTSCRRLWKTVGGRSVYGFLPLPGETWIELLALSSVPRCSSHCGHLGKESEDRHSSSLLLKQIEWIHKEVIRNLKKQ